MGWNSIRRTFLIGMVLCICFCLSTRPVEADHSSHTGCRDDVNRLSSEGNHDTAVILARKLLQKAEMSYGQDSVEAAGAMDALTEALEYLGKASEHERLNLLERSLSIKDRLLGPEHSEVVRILDKLTNLLVGMKNYSRAQPYAERALSILEKIRGPANEKIVGNIYSLAQIQQWLHDYEGARQLFERALAIKVQVLGPDHPEVAWSLHDLSVVHNRIGDVRGALQLTRRALAIQEKILGTRHRDYAYGLCNLALLLQQTGDNINARKYYETGIPILEDTEGPNSPRLAASLNMLGVVYRNLGKNDKAVWCHERALGILENAYGPDNPHMTWPLNLLVNLLYTTGDVTIIFDYSWRAENISRDNARLIMRYLPKNQALSTVAERQAGLDMMLSIAQENSANLPELKYKAWDALVRSRSLFLDEMAFRNRVLRTTDDIEASRLAHELASVCRRFANLTVKGPGEQDLDKYRHLLEETSRQKATIEWMLAEKSAEFRQELGRHHIGIADIARRIPSDTALVAFAKYNQHKVFRKRSWDVSSYLACVMRGNDKVPNIVSLGTAWEIDDLVRKWKEEAVRGARDPWREPLQSEAIYRRAGRSLREKIWDPLVPCIGDAKNVLVVPDGSLHLVNLAALPGEDNEYLVEQGKLIHYLSVERDLVPVNEAPRTGRGILALGGPDFDYTGFFSSLHPQQEKKQTLLASLFLFRGERSSCGDFQSLTFPLLPDAREEAKEIVSFWIHSEISGVHKQEQDATRQIQDILLLTGPEANETVFKQKASGMRVLHLATHGFFLAGNCPSGPEKSHDRKSPQVKEEMSLPSVALENPLLLSGLALAGANHREAAGTDEDDGILTAEEIAAMDLSGVELAVLSTCESGLGEIKNGEGVFGLQRAFRVAGTGTIIMSLSSVRDSTAREWMKVFYEAKLLKGMGAAQAVQEANLELLRLRRAEGQSTHPYFWSGFIASGEWR